MSLVTQLRSERAQLNEQIQALARIEADGGVLDAEQLASFEALNSAFNTLTDKLSRAEAAERTALASAVPLSEGAQGITSPQAGNISGPFTAKPIPGANMAQMVRLLAATRGDQQAAAKMASDGGMNPEIAMALSTVTPGAGGVLVPHSFSSEVIELLRPQVGGAQTRCRVAAAQQRQPHRAAHQGRGNCRLHRQRRRRAGHRHELR